jgi:hypothetical protein
VDHEIQISNDKIGEAIDILNTIRNKKIRGSTIFLDHEALRDSVEFLVNTRINLQEPFQQSFGKHQIRTFVKLHKHSKTKKRSGWKSTGKKRFIQGVSRAIYENVNTRKLAYKRRRIDGTYRWTRI